MPDILRDPHRLNCLGIDLVSPVDRMAPGAFPYLINARVVEEGRIDARPGYAKYQGALIPTAVHSIRRLNDVDEAFAAAGYTNIVGDGTTLQAGAQGAIAQIDTGYSGDPLSLIPFRPANSPASWMYVYDAAKQVKVRPDGTIRNIGVAPPTAAPATDYGVPAMVVAEEGFDGASWTSYGDGTVPGAASADRTNSSSPTITAIIYNSGTTGWCLIEPNLGSNSFWAGERMRIVLNSGGGNAETVAVREIHPVMNPSTTTIAAINYDSGTSGPCCIVLTNNVQGIERNSLLELSGGSEVIRVLSASYNAPLGQWSIRAVTTGTHAAGETVTGLISWYVYTTLAHVATETITCTYVSIGAMTGTTKGNAAAAIIDSENLAVANGRTVDPANDWMHLSFFVADVTQLVSVQIMIDVDALTTTVGGAGDAFTRNYYTWTVSAANLENSWNEILLPISQAVRSGNDLTRTLANVMALQVQITEIAGVAWGFDCWYLLGTYGPFVQPNSPVGLLYASANRESDASASVIGPTTRHELFPLREAVLVTPQQSGVAGVDSLDIYRQGNTLTDFTYIATLDNTFQLTLTDSLSDAVVAANPTADPTLLQPWVVLDLAWAGQVTVIGTSVLWVSGTQFNPALLANTVIIINSVAYQVRGQPHSATFLEIQTSGGYQANVFFQVGSPELAAQPLPYAFGTLEGPFAPVGFAIGDPKNAGTLYYSNSANLDAQSDANTLEITAPGEPLISGEVWQGIAYVGSHGNVFIVRYSYLQTIGVQSSGPVVYQFNRIPSASGMWTRWGICRGPDGVYFLGRDGIYRATEQGAVNITDAQLYCLFPHDGQAAAGSSVGGNVLLPVNMTQFSNLRLSCCDQDIYFDYLDSANNPVCLRYEIPKKRWFVHVYGVAGGVVSRYLVENSVTTPNDMEILLLGRSNGLIYEAGGDDDDGIAITTQVQLPSFDNGDERLQKLYIDLLTDADQVGTVRAAVSFNNQTIAGLTYVLTTALARNQYLSNISSLAQLSLYRNISIKYVWTGGPDGPRIYAFEPSAYAQPYVSTFLVTQFINLAYPGWKHHRRLYPGLISNAVVTLTIKTQDGRAYVIDIPSTGGQFRITPLMIPQDCKDLSFAYQLDGHGTPFALFPEAFTIETKEWIEPTFIELAVFKT